MRHAGQGRAEEQLGSGWGCRGAAGQHGLLPGACGMPLEPARCPPNGYPLPQQVELHADGSVVYEVFLFSRPDTLLAWASLPVVKIQQIRYVLDSIKAVAQAAQA